MQLENEVYEYIRQMIDEEASRLEIVESCISEFGDDYPDLEYNDWSKLVKSLIPKNEDEEEVSDIYLPPMPSQVSSVKDTYEKALSKLQRMVEWADTSSIPLEKWTVNGVSKWAKQYKECLELCKCLELDYFENSIDDALYNDISSAISKVEEYTSLLPKIKALDERYLDDSKSLNYSRRRKVKIPDYYSRKDKYLTLVSSIPPTTSSERKKLLKRYHDGDKLALDAIIESYLPLIYNMAVQFHSLYPHIDIQDFFGEGVEVFVYNYVLYESRYRNIIGYIMAAVKSRMAKYVGYAFPNFCVPSKSIQLITQIERFIEKYECTYGERPGAEYIASSLGLPFDDVINTCYLITGKNQHITFNEDKVGCIDNFFPDPDSRLLHESLSKEVASTLCTLTPREADILRNFLGIDTKEKSLEEIGDKLHLTRERVRQIKDKAIRKLNSGQRSHILQTYLGGITPSIEELEAYKGCDYYSIKTIHNINKKAIQDVGTCVDNEIIKNLHQVIAKSRKIIKTLSEWLKNKIERPPLTNSEVYDWENLNSQLDENYSILKQNIAYVSDKMIEELRTNILGLRKLYNSNIALLMATERKKSSTPTRTIPNISSPNETLQLYIKYFNSLTRSKRNGELAPHKIILLLAVLALYKNPEQQKTTLIKLSDDLKSLFDQYWKSYVKSDIWAKGISMPWKHMISEPFWHYDEKSKTTYIDKELRVLLKETENRIALRDVLKEQLKN